MFPSKKTYDRCEKLCHDIWKELYETGGDDKERLKIWNRSNSLHRYILTDGSCPACYMAIRAAGNYEAASCKLCPIKQNNSLFNIDKCLDGQYYIWYNNCSWDLPKHKKLRKDAAKKIMYLKWKPYIVWKNDCTRIMQGGNI
jgi:hypothetical protein